ncbi:MAG: hypothetical protein CMA37_05445, partial [Euryarchaeota archaeon]|nr:hypothetical protein [Euryarchaeota archaeon]
TPDCEDGEPNPEFVTIESTVEDTGQFLSGGTDVEWAVNDPEANQLTSDTGAMQNGQSQSFDYVARDIVPGIYEIKVDVTQGDNVNVENDVTITYPEGSEDSPNPRSE